ncbi:MAG TPA: polysaccharide deacetylase family protein [Myxococcota bacterium]|nr:polysaccharide deacetylase family protein [Myxococcota bacterium]HRY93123.1 polysaccharide deacetylase family protein [Myxococcota bacterium]
MLAISIDLDPLSCYRRLYGLPEEEAPGADPVVSVAVERFLELMHGLGAKGTLFCVGESLAHPEAQAALRAAAAAGHELANHTWSHPYALSRLPDPALARELGDGARAVQALSGQPPAGFRAPGYLLGPRVLAAARAAGARYDASALPSPLYQAAKAGAVGLLALLGRPSAAILGDPREALGRTRPYPARLDRPWRAARPGEDSLLELPISAALGLPLTGGLLAQLGPRAAGALGAGLARRGWVQLELHGVDLLDLRSDGLPPGLGAERSLRVPWRIKAEIYRAFLQRVMERHEAGTLEDIAVRQFLVPGS